MRYLLHLNVSACSLKRLSLRYMSSIKILDISWNQLTSLSSIDTSDVKQFTFLSLSGNPLIQGFLTSVRTFLCDQGRFIEELYLSATRLDYIPPHAFSCHDNQEGRVSILKILDISHNDVEAFKGSFSNLANLQELRCSDKVFCCIFELEFPDLKTDCQAPVDELSSCAAILASNFLRVGLWVLALASILGNGVVIVYRLAVWLRRLAWVQKIAGSIHSRYF